MIKNFFIFLMIYFFWPAFSFSQIIFSEIMANPKGTDAGREWVEIKNTAGFSLSLEKYKFCEGKPTCHSWAKGKNDNFNIEAGALAIITDDKEKFLADYPNYSGLILVSTGFTLTNTGELIQIKNPDRNLDDSLTYNPDPNAKEGDSLSLFDDTWKNSQPTPGEENIYKDPGGDGSGEEDDDVNRSYVQISDRIAGKKKLKAEIDPPGTWVAGARTSLFGRAYGLSGAEINGIDFYWNYGDGETDYGQKVFHSYSFPGEYIVTLTVKSGNFTGSTREKIKVIEPDLEIAEVVESKKGKTGYIKIKNNTDYLLNLEDWMIFVDGERFLIPDQTYINKKSENIFPNNITSLRVFNNELKKSKVFLLLPNGEKFKAFEYKKENDNLEKENTGENKKEVNVSKSKKPTKKKKGNEIKVIARAEARGKEDFKQKQQANILDNNFLENREILKINLNNKQRDFFGENIFAFSFLIVSFILLLLVLWIRNSVFNFSEEDKDDEYKKEISDKAKEFEIKEI